jgi:hypothetical protein
MHDFALLLLFRLHFFFSLLRIYLAPITASNDTVDIHLAFSARRKTGGHALPSLLRAKQPNTAVVSSSLSSFKLSRSLSRSPSLGLFRYVGFSYPETWHQEAQVKVHASSRKDVAVHPIK